MNRVDFSREEQARKRLVILSAAAEMPASKVLRILIENAPSPEQLRKLADKNEGDVAPMEAGAMAA